MNLPAYLYHGSMFNVGMGPLQPGFNYTGILVEWDVCESNRFLYATTDEHEAILLGICSMIEKTYDISECHIDGKIVRIVGDRTLDRHEAVKDKIIYMYLIKPNPADKWLPNKNPHNNMQTEWKTGSVIKKGFTTVPINVPVWLAKNKYELVFE